MFDKSQINTRAELHNEPCIVLSGAALCHRLRQELSWCFLFFFCTSDAFVVLPKCAQSQALNGIGLKAKLKVAVLCLLEFQECRAYLKPITKRLELDGSLEEWIKFQSDSAE